MKIVAISILIALALLVITYSDTINSEEKVQSLYEKGLEMTERLVLLAESEEYMKLFSNSPEINVIAKDIGSIDYSNPKATYEIIGIDTAYMEQLLSQTDIKLNLQIKDIVKKKVVEGIASLINSQNGAIFLATTSIITVSDSFIYSGIEEQKTYLFIYERDYASIITFTPIQDNIVISSGNIAMHRSFAKIKTVEDVSTFFENTIELTGLEISRW